MFSETDLKEAAHPLVMHVLVVERSKHRTLRDAQKYIADRLGGSARWLRRIIGRCPNAVLHSHQMLNLVSLYHERQGDSGPIKALWRRVLQRRPKFARIRAMASAQFSPLKNDLRQAPTQAPLEH